MGDSDRLEEVINRLWRRLLSAREQLSRLTDIRNQQGTREAAMRLVNHASELVRQIDQREKVEDVGQWRESE